MNNFNPHDWLPENRKDQQRNSAGPKPSPFPADQNSAAVEAALQAIEISAIDITSSYSRWMEIGFSLANEFGEGGRDYFHRVSRFHPEYNQKECDGKYSNFLKSTGSGIGIGTFFHHVKNAGLRFHPGEASLPQHLEYTRSAIPAPGTLPAEESGESKLAQNSQKGNEDVPSTPSPPVSSPSQASVGVAAPMSDESLQNIFEPLLQDLSAGQGPSSGGETSEDLGQDQVQASVPPLPVLPEALYTQLPHFLQRVVAKASTPEERDLLLLGSLGAMSACFPKLFGIYHGKKVSANIYLFVTAPASAGKGRLSLCKQLVLPIHGKLREQAQVLKLQYAHELADYNQSQKDKEKPGKPPERMLFIPANNSSTGAFQLLADNEGRGLIFETEGDTLTQSFRSDYGNYSDGFRKAFHHETISYYRRTDREYVDIESPCLSTVLSGTPKQVTSLIPSAENGLLSRFLFYYMNLKPKFQNVFANDEHEGMDAYYWELGKEFLELYETLNTQPPLRFHFTKAQQVHFVSYFETLENLYQDLQPEEFIATIRRLALSTFRMAMILNALRIMEDGDISPDRYCLQKDFDSVMTLAKVLVKHSSAVFNLVPEEEKLEKKSNLKERFLEALPYQFTTRDFLSIAAGLKLPEKTASNYMTQFVRKKILHREKNGSYLNPAKAEADA